MQTCRWLCGLALGLALLGCSDGIPTQEPVELPPREPLSVAEWKELPVQQKYDPVSFERLKLNDPKLKDEQEWGKFMREVVVPERRKDLPEESKNLST